MADEVRYHINEKGNPGICRAKKRCRFGDLSSEHYSTKEEARAAYERRMEESGKGSATSTVSGGEKSSPMSVVPQAHSNIHELSDAFYRLTPEQDEEALTHLAEYHYSKAMYNLTGDADEELAMVAAKAKLLNTRVGSKYTGYKGDSMEMVEGMSREEIEAIDTSIPPPPAEAAVADEFLGDGEMREDLKGAEAARVLATYANDSREFLTHLTAEEHNAVAYWTGPGAHAAHSLLHASYSIWDDSYSDEGDVEQALGNRYLDVLDSALEKAPITAPRVLYKGLSLGHISDAVANKLAGNRGEGIERRHVAVQWAREKYPVGSEVTFDAPQSTSMDAGVARGFARSDVAMEIKCTKEAPVGALSSWGYKEREYLAPRTTKYCVVGVKENQPYERLGRHGSPPKFMLVIQLEQVVE